MNLIIRNAFLREFGRRLDIGVERGRIVQIEERLPGKAAQEIDADGRLVTPALVDLHIHLDAVLTEGEPRHNMSGTLLEGIEIWSERKKSITHDDVKRRATQAIKWELAHGVTRIRTHVDVCDPNLTALKALREVKSEFWGLVDIQIVAFPQEGILSYPAGEELLAKAIEKGADVVGGIPHYEWTRDDGVRDVQIALELARKHNKLVDIHCDETDDEHSRFLEVLAAETIRWNYHGKVTASHATALHSYNNAYAFKLMGWVRRAQLTIVTNPLDNSVLQGRFDAYPKRRGHTRVKELLEAGVNVCIGHDSIQDPWYPLGIGDPLQAAFVLLHYGQMSGYAEIPKLFDMLTYHPAKAFGAEDYGIGVGKKADLVIFDGRSEMEVLTNIAPRLYVIREGQIVAETKPGETRILWAGGKERIRFER